MKEFTLHPHIGKGLHTARGCLKDRQLIIERWSPCDLCIFSMIYLIFNALIVFLARFIVIIDVIIVIIAGL